MRINSKIKTGALNTLFLATGNILGQAIGFVFNIYIANKLDVSEYGVVNTVAAFVGMFGFITLNGYQKVIIRKAAGNKEKLGKLLEDTLGIKMFFSLTGVAVTIISSFCFNYNIQTILFICIYSFTLFFNGMSSILDVVFHVNKKMQYISIISLCQRIIYVVPSIICLSIGGGVASLIWLFTFSTVANTIINYYVLSNVFSVRFSFKKITKIFLDVSLLKEASIFSLLGFIGYFYEKIDVVMLSWILGAESVGLYMAGYKFILPMQLISNLAGTAFFPQMVERFKDGTPVKAISLFRASFIITLIVLPITFCLSLLADEIILYTFGPRYIGAVPVLKYLCWIVPLTAITKPFVLAMQVNHHERKLILPNILRSLSNVVLNYFFIIKYGYIGVVYSTIGTYLWYYVFINFGYQYYVLKKFGNIV